MSQGYHIYDFERGMFWKGDKWGYTHEVLEAGVFDYEDARKIVEDSNIIYISSEMVHVTDMKRLASIQNEKGEKQKIDMFEVVKKFTEQYYKTNPLADIKMELEKNGYYCEEDTYEHLSNNTSGRYTLFPKRYNTGLNVVVSRLDSGNYEVTANKITLESKNNIIPNLKRKNGLK